MQFNPGLDWPPNTSPASYFAQPCDGSTAPVRTSLGFAAKEHRGAQVVGVAVLLVLLVKWLTPAAETSDGSSGPAAGGSVEYSFSFDRLRPIWHVMPVSRWQNDPNGPVYYGGCYHLFYQHNSYEESSIW